MKNFIRKASFILTGVFMITACSQTESIVVERGPQYRYSKVYEGNKILYRDLKKEDSRELASAAESIDMEAGGKKDAVQDIALESEKAETVQSKGDHKQDVPETFVSNLRQARQNLVTGRLFSGIKKADRIRSYDGTVSGDDHTSVMSTGDLFAILGFVFGLVGFLGSGLGIAASILGLVFSILGLNSNLRIFAIIGLVVSIVSLVVAIVAL